MTTKENKRIFKSLELFKVLYRDSNWKILRRAFWCKIQSGFLELANNGEQKKYRPILLKSL